MTLAFNISIYLSEILYFAHISMLFYLTNNGDHEKAAGFIVTVAFDRLF